MEACLRVLFKVSSKSQIQAMKNTLSGKGEGGDELFVDVTDDGSYDLVVNVESTFKDKAIVFDHSGTVHRLGLPCEYQFDELERKNDGMDKQEIIRKEIEKLEKLPKECPKCKFMKPAGAPSCPKCGFKPLGGEDVETDESRQIQKLKAKLDKPVTQQEKQQLYSELHGFVREMRAKGKNYSDGWIGHKYKEKFGVWPQGLHTSPKPVSIETRNWIRSQQIRYAKGRKKPASNEIGARSIRDLRAMLKEPK